MDNQNQRNLILAVVLTALILFGWEAGMRYLYPNADKASPVAAAPSAPAGTPAAEPSPAAKPTREGGLMSDSDKALEAKDLASALNPAQRVAIDAPGLTGSINLVGGIVDDLSTRRHTAGIEKTSGLQRIFSPAGTPAQHYAQFGWVGENGLAAPTAATVWTAPAGAKLTPASPVTLTWDNGAGQTYTLTYAIDADYMLTVTQGMRNAGAAPVSAKPFALINRTDKTASVDTWNVHSGPFGAFDGTVAFNPNYKDVLKAGEIANTGKPDWLGFTDVYWMSTLIPDKSAASSDFRALGDGIYRADVIYPQAAVAAGQASTLTTRLFAGAKD